MAIVNNSIIWGNQIRIDTTQISPDSIRIKYSDVQCGWLEDMWKGEGNICTEPMFVNPEQVNFHLLSNSPCIDSGNPDPIHNDMDGSKNDMGAFGGLYGNWGATNVETNRGELLIPQNIIIYQNYPNPFNSNTKISFQINKNYHIKVKILNSNGQEIADLLNEEKQPGYYSLIWNGSSKYGNIMSSGIYVCFIEFKNISEEFIKINKMICVK